MQKTKKADQQPEWWQRPDSSKKQNPKSDRTRKRLLWWGAGLLALIALAGGSEAVVGKIILSAVIAGGVYWVFLRDRTPVAIKDKPDHLGTDAGSAAALIPSEDPADAVFYDSARDLLDALISHLIAKDGDASLPSIRSLIQNADDYKSLLRTLAASPDPDVGDIARNLAMVAANERLLGSIFATLRSNLRFLRYPKIRASLEVSDFSLADLAGDQPTALFLQFEEHQRETTARLLAAMVAHIMRYLICHTDRPPVLLFLDEIGTVPPIPGLIPKLNTIRSRNLPTWTYWQSFEQMQRYGAKAGEGSNLILGACDLQMVFRLNDNASAQWMSERIGVVDVTVRSETTNNGFVGIKVHGVP